MMQSTPSQQWGTSGILLNGIKCEGICPTLTRVLHINLHDRVAISNIFDIGYTCAATSHISLPRMTVSDHRQEGVKGGSAGASTW